MSRKKFRYNDNMTEDDLRKEIYREVWYNLRSDIRKDRRERARVHAYCGISVYASGGPVEDSGSFVGLINIGSI